MEKIIKRKIGQEVHTFMIQADSFHDLIMESKKLSFGDVDKCGICGSDWLELGAHVAGVKKFKYTTIRCKKCKSCLNFGQPQSNPSMYYLKTRDGDESKNEPKKVLDWQTADQQKFTEDNQ